MKVSKVTKLKEKYVQYDLSTETENFYVKAGDRYVLVHNSPAVFVGIDPSDGEFFVAKKGIFNKEPDLYKTQDDIKARLSGDLAVKFSVALEEFKKLGIKKGVYQGDLMFTNDTVGTETINGVKYYTFQPNTIVYAVPVKSNIGSQIRKAKIGVAWHTTYTGSTLESMSAKFATNIVKNFKRPSSIWQVDATLNDLSGTATFTKAETEEVTKLLSDAGRLFQRLPKSLFDGISTNDEMKIRVKKFINDHIRANTIVNPKGVARKLMDYVHDYYKGQIDSKKTSAGRDPWIEKQRVAMKLFTDHKPSDFENLFEMMNLISTAKQKIIDKLNAIGDLSTFIRTKNGFSVTSQEGYVAVDRIGNAIKLVDRLEFSRANFSPDVLKGFDKRN